MINSVKQEALISTQNAILYFNKVCNFSITISLLQKFICHNTNDPHTNLCIQITLGIDFLYYPIW